MIDCKRFFDEVPKGYSLIVVGDWNARVGSSDDIYRHIIGKFGLDEWCKNDGHFLNFAGTNRTCFSNTQESIYFLGVRKTGMLLLKLTIFSFVLTGLLRSRIVVLIEEQKLETKVVLTTHWFACSCDFT